MDKAFNPPLPPLKSPSRRQTSSPPNLSAGATGLLLALPFPLFVGICHFSAQFGNSVITGDAGLFMVQIICCEFGPCFSILLTPWQVKYIFQGIRNERGIVAWVALVVAAVPWVLYGGAMIYSLLRSSD